MQTMFTVTDADSNVVTGCNFVVEADGDYVGYVDGPFRWGSDNNLYTDGT